MSGCEAAPRGSVHMRAHTGAAAPPAPALSSSFRVARGAQCSQASEQSRAITNALATESRRAPSKKPLLSRSPRHAEGPPPGSSPAPAGRQRHGRGGALRCLEWAFRRRAVPRGAQLLGRARWAAQRHPCAGGARTRTQAPRPPSGGFAGACSCNQHVRCNARSWAAKSRPHTRRDPNPLALPVLAPAAAEPARKKTRHSKRLIESATTFKQPHSGLFRFCTPSRTFAREETG